MFKNDPNKNSKLIITLASIYSIFYSNQSILLASNSSGLGSTSAPVPAHTTEVWWANFCENLFRAETPNKVEGPLNFYLTQYGNQSGLSEEEKALLKHYKERWDAVKSIVDRVRQKSRAKDALTRYERGVGTLITQMRNHFNPASSSSSSASQPPQTQSSSAGATSASASSSSSSSQSTQNHQSGLNLPNNFVQGGRQFILKPLTEKNTPVYNDSTRASAWHVTIPNNQRGGSLGYTFHVTNNRTREKVRYHYDHNTLKWGYDDLNTNSPLPKETQTDSPHNIARRFLDALLRANNN